ncbi:WXG100 family type VII secretion target [Nocardia sp. CA-290969]|uniref:WXG100 family type VII secretion target n=1 Tax=Nocardia sp. CA-290969 TaxID=3239986 RepID=UPI003D8FEB69
MSNVPEYENPIIGLGGENPKEWDHERIKNAFDPLVVDDAKAQSDKYWEMRVSWEEGVETFIRSINTSLAQAWSGPAAEQSRQAIKDYVDKHARPVTPALEALSNGIASAVDAIVTMKKSVGNPLDVTGLDGFTNWLFSEDEAERRTQEARTAMTTHYVNPFGELDTLVPVVPIPVGPTSTTDIPAPPPGGYPTGTGTPSTPGSPTGTTPGETPTGETPGTPEDETPGETPGEETTQPSTTTTGQTPTTPTGAEPPGSTTPTVPAGTTPAGVTTGSPSGTPGTPGSPGSPETPGPGRTVQGTPSTAPGTPAATATTAGAPAGTRGMAGMPMGAAGAGRGAGQDDESKRSTPDYLINQENTDELLGELPPTIEGGVIGSTPE